MILNVEIFVFCFVTLGLDLLTFGPVDLVDATAPLLDLMGFRFGLETLAALRLNLPGLAFTTLFLVTLLVAVCFCLVAAFWTFTVFFVFLAMVLSLDFGETLSRANEYVFNSFLRNSLNC